MDEQEDPGQTQKGNLQSLEAKTCNMEGIQRCSLSIHGWN